VPAEAPHTATALLAELQARLPDPLPAGGGVGVCVTPRPTRKLAASCDDYLGAYAARLEAAGYAVQRLRATDGQRPAIWGLAVREKDAPFVGEAPGEHTLTLRIHPLAAAALATLTPMQYRYAEAAAVRGLRDYLVGLDLLPAVAPLAEGQAVTLTFPGAAAPVELPAVVVRASHALTSAERGGLPPLSGPYTTFRYTRPDDTTGEIMLLDTTLPTFVKGS
jgi:hypothetical protein